MPYLTTLAYRLMFDVYHHWWSNHSRGDKIYALLDNVGIEVKLLSEGWVQTHQLSSLAVLRNIVLYMAPSRVCTVGYRVVFGPFKSVFLTSGIPITPLRATLFFFTKAVTSSRELGGFCLESTLKSRKTNLLAPLFTSEKYTSSKSIYELKTRLAPTTDTKQGIYLSPHL